MTVDQWVKELECRIHREPQATHMHGRITLTLDEAEEIMTWLTNLVLLCRINKRCEERVLVELADECRFDIPNERRKKGMRPVTTNNGVKAVHLPSKITAIVANRRTQHRNRAAALRMIREGLREESNG